MSDRTCLICSVSISGLSSRAKYCSTACKSKAYRQRNPEGYKEKTERYKKKYPDRILKSQQKYRVSSGRSKTKWSPDMEKNCEECGKQFKPPKFHPFMRFCSRKCGQKVNQRNWQKNNPARAKEIMKKYDASEKRVEARKRNYSWQKEYNKKWLEDNPGKSAEYSRRYKEKHPEKVRENRQKYIQSVKGMFLNRKRSHIVRMLVKKNYNHNNLIKILEEQNNSCPLCGSDYGDNLENMELGHILPMSKFPLVAGDVENIIPICKSCNRSMRNNIFSEWCIKKGYYIPLRVIIYEKKQRKLIDFVD